MSLRGATICGVGSYLPETVLTNADWERMVDTTDEWIIRHTGISERRLAADDQASSDLAIRAAQRALDDADISPEQIGLVILATATPDHFFPATACLVQDAIGAKNAGAMDLSSGCTGFIYAMAAGASFVRSGDYDYVLLISAEVLTRIADWTDRSTCVLFGDGAGAAVMGPCGRDEGLLSFALSSHGEYGDLLILPGGGSRLRLTPELIAQRQDCLQMQGPEIFKLAVRGIPRIAKSALDKAGLSASDVSAVIMHQANRRILDAAADRLDIDPEKMVNTVGKYGNTSAASVPMCLDDTYRKGQLAPGDIVLFVGFGAGFTLGAAVVRWTLPPPTSA